MSMLAHSTLFVYPTASPDTLGVDHSFPFSISFQKYFKRSN